MPNRIFVQGDDRGFWFDDDQAIAEWSVNGAFGRVTTLYRLPHEKWVLCEKYLLLEHVSVTPALPLGKLISETEALCWLVLYNQDIPEEFRSEIARRNLLSGTAVVIPALSQRQYEILDALREMGAISPEERRTTSDVARAAEGRQADPLAFKEPIVALKQRGLVDTREGRGGGVWLTEVGLQVANRHRQSPDR